MVLKIIWSPRSRRDLESIKDFIYCEALGRTRTGRYLTAFFILKPGNEVIVISARDMAQKERKRFDRK